MPLAPESIAMPVREWSAADQKLPLAIVRFRRAKAFAIFLGSHRHLLKESSAQRLLIPKTRNTSDPLQRHINALQMLSRSFHPKRLYPSGWRATELGLKPTRKGARAHRHDLCQRADIQLSSKVRSGPHGEVTHPIGIYVFLLRKQLTVLRLAAGASQEEHEVPGNRGGHRVP